VEKRISERFKGQLPLYRLLANPGGHSADMG